MYITCTCPFVAETPTQERKPMLATPTPPGSAGLEPHPPTPEQPVIHIDNIEDEDEGAGGGDEALYDDMLILSNNQPYYDDEEEEEEGTSGGGVTAEGNEETRGEVPTSGGAEPDHVSLTATDPKLSKVMPSLVTGVCY